MRGHHYHNVASNEPQNNATPRTYMFGQNDTQQQKLLEGNLFMKNLEVYSHFIARIYLYVIVNQ